ncbi:hypothetical protein SBRCBS47491_008008 [Sporothrix bragantina]|uniref:NADAR domain-containing protein n=1 Tax=Sporothrix bragantina TaxID=671064 RepID=A0ABP0CKQ0_9PEZI
MPDAKHGELCQWFPAPFAVDVAAIEAVVEYVDIVHPAAVTGPSITFSCAEQFMMYCKAARFNDTTTMHRVLATADPKEQKRLGKQVEGFNEDWWAPVKSAVVVVGNVAKFGQNPKLRGKLIATGDRLLVEAASRDRVWGIGYTEKHAMSFREHWGENRLGLALMEARRILKDKQANKHTWE